MTSAPLVSVIIVCWNSTKYLSDCLSALEAQTFRDFEIMLVDNGSTDGAPDEFIKNYPHLNFKFKQLGSNLGFAVANNIGAHSVPGKWLALLNADAFPEPDWLEQLLCVAEQNPEYASFSSRQIQANNPNFLDGAGDAYHVSGLAWRISFGYPSAYYGLNSAEIFSPCAAAALYLRESFLEVGGFDEDYFSYFEDVDLGFRLRLSGKKCRYVPEAVVHHIGSASTGKRSDFSVYYGYRNMIWTFVKNMPALLFWIFLPLHISAILFFAFYLTLRGQGRAIWKAVFDALRGLPKMIEKRKLIQKRKKIKSYELLKVMSISLFKPLQEFLHRNKSK